MSLVLEYMIRLSNWLHEWAFESLNRECNWIALRRNGIPKKLTAIITTTYNGAKWRVLYRDSTSKKFEVQSGVCYDCILSPILILLVSHDSSGYP